MGCKHRQEHHDWSCAVFPITGVFNYAERCVKCKFLVPTRLFTTRAMFYSCRDVIPRSAAELSL